MHSEELDQQVVHQDIALDTYLSTLLDEIPSDFALEQTEKKKIETKSVVIDEQVDAKIRVKLKKLTKLKEDKIVTDQANIMDQSIKIGNPLSVMPDWSQQEFSALFFKIDKLILAVPLTDLLRTIKIENSPTKIPGQPSWFIGLLDNKEHRVGVLDTGQLVFGKVKGQQRDLQKQPFKSILITYDGNWGLACDEILSIGTLEPEKIRWRTLRNKRPWLIGTVIEELTAIIDVNQLVPHRKSELEVKS